MNIDQDYYMTLKIIEKRWLDMNQTEHVKCHFLKENEQSVCCSRK